MSEWNLSDKEKDSGQCTCDPVLEDMPVYLEEDVKEFIRRLKEKSVGITHVDYFHKLINKLAGDKLK
jgi:hypothetical protein